MAKSSIKIRARLKNGITTVKAIISHPMETGLRKDKKSGQTIPAKFIQNVKCELNHRVLLNCQWGIAISKNPYVSFKYSGSTANDIIRLTWVDNNGRSDSMEAKVS